MTMFVDDFFCRCDMCGADCVERREEPINGYLFVLCSAQCQFDLVVALMDLEVHDEAA